MANRKLHNGPITKLYNSLDLLLTACVGQARMRNRCRFCCQEKNKTVRVLVRFPKNSSSCPTPPCSIGTGNDDTALLVLCIRAPPAAGRKPPPAEKCPGLCRFFLSQTPHKRKFKDFRSNQCSQTLKLVLRHHNGSVLKNVIVWLENMAQQWPA